MEIKKKVGDRVTIEERLATNPRPCPASSTARSKLRRAPPLSRPFPAKPQRVGRRFLASPTAFEPFKFGWFSGRNSGLLLRQTQAIRPFPLPRALGPCCLSPLYVFKTQRARALVLVGLGPTRGADESEQDAEMRMRRTTMREEAVDDTLSQDERGSPSQERMRSYESGRFLGAPLRTPSEGFNLCESDLTPLNLILVHTKHQTTLPISVVQSSPI
ncbi:hypothetical protein DVH24_004104 [Malus domestica]|uniref:Uncharacterized protein n=1 Tax=Malus domestica TaxID=3750 RepID=A0A498KD86_MALDO|nr:hypothetical protein DVH24_004104 [Malus domestica]